MDRETFVCETTKSILSGIAVKAPNWFGSKADISALAGHIMESLNNSYDKHISKPSKK